MVSPEKTTIAIPQGEGEEIIIPLEPSAKQKTKPTKKNPFGF